MGNIERFDEPIWTILRQHIQFYSFELSTFI